MITQPDRLLRFFRTEEHALQFIECQLRFGLLEYHRNLEGELTCGEAHFGTCVEGSLTASAAREEHDEYC